MDTVEIFIKGNRMKIIVMGILALFLSCYIAIVLVSGEEKRPQYRLPLPTEVRDQFEIQASNFMIQGLAMSNIAAKINEAIHCPCYDVKITTAPNVTLIRIDNEKCKEIK